MSQQEDKKITIGKKEYTIKKAKTYSNWFIALGIILTIISFFIMPVGIIFLIMGLLSIYAGYKYNIAIKQQKFIVNSTNDESNNNDSLNTGAVEAEQLDKNKNKKPKKILLGVVIVILVSILTIVGCIESDKRKDPEYVSTKILTEATELDDEHAKAIFEDFKSVGIDELISCELESKKDDKKVYDFECKKCKGTLKIKDKKTYEISSGYIYLFTTFGAVRNINDYYINDDKELHLISIAELSVKKCLKSPGSAEFPSRISGDWQITRYKNTVTMKSHVDSQNGFGAMIRSNFTCQISYDKEEILYLNIDGKDMFGTFVEKAK